MENLISKYLDYKINRLTLIGVSLLGDKSKYSYYILGRYLRVYVDSKYYFKYITTCSGNFDNSYLNIEFDALRLEEIELLNDMELEYSNSDFVHNKYLIDKSREIIDKVIKFDINIDTERVEEVVYNICLENNKEIVNIIKEYNNIYNKILKLEDNYFRLEYIRFKDKLEIYTRLGYSIDTLNSYKINLVNNVYKEKEFNKNKFIISINKLSLLILVNNFKINNLYLVKVEEEDLYRGKFISDIYELIDNDILRRYICLVISNKLYKERREYFDSLGYRIIISLDLSRDNDISTTLDEVNKFMSYQILVLKYKERDRDYIYKYSRSDNSSLLLLDFYMNLCLYSLEELVLYLRVFFLELFRCLILVYMDMLLRHIRRISI